MRYAKTGKKHLLAHHTLCNYSADPQGAFCCSRCSAERQGAFINCPFQIHIHHHSAEWGGMCLSQNSKSKKTTGTNTASLGSTSNYRDLTQSLLLEDADGRQTKADCTFFTYLPGTVPRCAEDMEVTCIQWSNPELNCEIPY